MKWQNLAAPDDPESYYDVDGFWPTRRGTYERVRMCSAAEATATGAGTVRYAFAAATLSSIVEWVVDSSKIWVWNGVSYTDRTNGVTIGTYPHMCQYGNVTICAMGVGAATVASTSGGNFSAIAAAPNCEIVAACSNAVGYFNTATSTDGYTISDVGDYTNTTTGEAVTGRLIQTPGPITAVVPFAGGFIVFKPSSTYRLRYVGGDVKWVVEVLDWMRGCSPDGQGTTVTLEKYTACASPHGVLFISPSDPFSDTASAWYMDSAGQFRCVSPLTDVLGSDSSRYVGYSPALDMFWLWGFLDTGASFYSPSTGQWGRSTAPSAAPAGAKPVMGHGIAVGQSSAMPTHYYKVNADKLTRYTPGLSVAGAAYLQTSMQGKVNRKTKFTRCIPLLRARTNIAGAPAATLSATFYRELHDTSAASTQSISESSTRKRFDFTATDNFARFKITYTDIHVEADGVMVEAVDAGRD